MTSYALRCIIPGTSVFKFPLVKYLENQKLLILEITHLVTFLVNFTTFNKMPNLEGNGSD